MGGDSAARRLVQDVPAALSMAVCSQAELKSGNNMMLTETKTIRRSFLFEDLENKVINSQCSLLKI